MIKQLIIVFALLIGVYTQVYSSSLLDFTYEYTLINRICDIYGYDYRVVEDEMSESDHVYRIRIEDDSCVAILIQEANLLKRADTIPQYFHDGIATHMQLILAKQGYGYDVLNFMGIRTVDGIELNGKPMCNSDKWKLFVEELIKYHQKHKKITHELLKEILRKSGMMK